MIARLVSKSSKCDSNDALESFVRLGGEEWSSCALARERWWHESGSHRRIAVVWRLLASCGVSPQPRKKWG